MIKRTVTTLIALSAVTSLSGCVSYPRTNMLITPVGVAGVHSFKPKEAKQEIKFPIQNVPDRVAATNEQPTSEAAPR